MSAWDREDRAAATKREVQLREKPKPRKPKVKKPSQIVDELERKGSVYVPQSQAARVLPALKKDIETRLPGRRVVYENNRLKVHEPAGRIASGPRKSSGLGGLGGLGRTLAGDVAQLGSGIAGMAADYGVAGVRDVRDLPKGLTGQQMPFSRVGRLAGRDILGTIGALETAIPEPTFLPESWRKEIITVDPENLRIGRGSGKVDPTDSARAAKFWREDPLIAAATVLPLTSAVTRSASVGALTRSIRKANPDLPMKRVRQVARKESRMPGYAAAQGVKGGIAPRVLDGQYGTSQARPWSRSPEGRALQRFYDRQSEKIEAQNPGRKFSTSQRAQRQSERLDRRGKQQADLEADLLERTVYKAAKRDKAKREALVAVLEGPKGVTPREAVELRLADVRTQATAAIGADRAKIQLQLDNRIAALEKSLEGDWIDSPSAAKAADEMEALSSYLDEQYKLLYPDADDAMLAARRDKLVRRYAERGLIEGQETTRPRRPDEAQVRLEELETTLRENLRPIVDSAFPPAVRQKEQALRNARPKGKRAEQAIRDKLTLEGIGEQSGSVLDDAYKRIEEQVFTMAARPDIDPIVKKVAGMIEERNKLRAELSDPEYHFGDKTELDLGEVTEWTPAQGVTARGYFPHRDLFDDVYAGSGGGPVVSAKGSTVGVPKKSLWATKKANKLSRYEAGRVKNDPKVLASTARGRNKLIWDIKARRDLYDVGDEISDLSEITEEMMVVRNPDAPPTRLDLDVQRAVSDPEVFGEALTPDFRSKAQESWLFDPQRGVDKPEWLVDVANVRLVPRSLVRTRMADVFPSAPQGLQATGTAIAGALNSLARFSAIYTPYGGARYVLRNTPQNMILLALSQPKAFRNLGESIRGLRKSDYDLYRRVEIETGSVPAAAGLPDLAGRRLGKTQKAEAGITWASRKTAGALGEVSDQPWRIASWIEYARQYGFESRADWRRLIDSDDANLVRVRNDISQRVREDMIDFDSLSPVERESISRFLFIYPFVKGAAKWPFVYARERPFQGSILTLLAAQHAREGAEGKPVYEQGFIDIAGKPRNLGWLDPRSPAAGTGEDLVNIAKEALEIPSQGPQGVTQEILGMAAPQYRELFKQWDDPKGYLRSHVPGYSTKEKIEKGGSLTDQALRGLGVEAPPPRSQRSVTTRRENLVADLEKIGRAKEIENPYISGALKLQGEWSSLMAASDSVKDKWTGALDVAVTKKFITPKRRDDLAKWAETQTEHEQELFLDRIEYHYFGEKVLRKARDYVNEQLRAKGLEPEN